MGYVPEKFSGQGEGPCRSTTQSTQILSGYQPQRRSDVNRGFVPHFRPLLNWRTCVSLTRSSCKDGLMATFYCNGQEFFKKLGENLALARSTARQLKKRIGAAPRSDYGTRKSGKFDISDREAHIRNAISAPGTSRL